MVPYSQNEYSCKSYKENFTMGWMYAAKRQSKSSFYAPNRTGGSLFHGLQMLTQNAPLKYLKGSLSKGTTSI